MKKELITKHISNIKNKNFNKVMQNFLTYCWMVFVVLNDTFFPVLSLKLLLYTDLKSLKYLFFTPFM